MEQEIEIDVMIADASHEVICGYDPRYDRVCR